MSRRLSVWAAGAVLLAARLALASEEGHAHGGGIPFATLLLSTINLLLFLWVLGHYVLPPVRNWVLRRHARVVKALEDAAAAKAAALHLRAEWEARLAACEQTIAEMRAQARRDAQRDRDRILAAAHAAAETIRKDAERAAAYELRRTQQQVRAELVQEAVRLAEEMTRREWSAADQQRYVADFLKQVRQ